MLHASDGLTGSGKPNLGFRRCKDEITVVHKNQRWLVRWPNGTEGLDKILMLCIFDPGDSMRITKYLITFVAALSILSSCASSSTEIQRVLFVYDISNSAREWVRSQVNSTTAWLKSQGDIDVEVSAIVIDAYGGTDNCQRPVNEPVNGEPGKNDVTRQTYRNENISQVSQRISIWLGCELENNLSAGSDIALAEFQGYQTIVIFSDGLLKVKSDNIDIYSLITSEVDYESSAQQISSRYSNQGVSLQSTRIELWGLGYKKNLSATQADRLKSFWNLILTDLDVSSSDIIMSSNLP